MVIRCLIIAIFSILTACGCAAKAPDTSSVSPDAASATCETNLTDPSCAPPPDTVAAPQPSASPRASPSERVPRITVDELLEKIKKNADILVIDARADVDQQFVIAHIKGATPVPLAMITSGQWTPPPEKTKEIVFYCTWPNEQTSARAALELIDKGYSNVKALKGGYTAWKDAGYPLESGNR